MNMTEWDYSGLRGRFSAPLVSADGREQFFLDVRRARLGIRKGTYQIRARQVVNLARLDFGDRPHRNPDGGQVGSPHLHVYRKGYGDKWAFLLPADHFQNRDDPWRMLVDFMRYSNITEPPVIKRGLFA